LSKTLNDCALRAQNQNARAGKKEGGWGEGIFARPRFPSPPNFVFCIAKCAAINGVVFAPPARAHTTINSLVKIKEKMYSKNMITMQYYNTSMAQENKVGKNIKKLRQAKGLSQDRLSKLADVSYNSIIKLETGGITNPTIETLQKIAKALDVQVDDLIK